MNEDKRKITVWKNGKQVKLSMHQPSSNDYASGKKEQAATLSDLDEEPIPPYTRITINEEPEPNPFLKMLIKFKPAIVAVVSALLIGSFLGVMLLKMFVTIDDNGNASGEINEVTAINNDEKQTNATLTTSIEPLQAFVIQAGVFSTEENAKKWQATYQDIGFPTVIWEKDRQYYLLLAAAPTKNKATELKNQAALSKMDVYVKEWETDKKELALTKEESKWLESFINKWEKSMEQQTFDNDSWASLQKTVPKGSKKFQDLSALMKQYINTENQVDPLEIGTQLLKLWHTLFVSLEAK